MLAPAYPSGCPGVILVLTGFLHAISLSAQVPSQQGPPPQAQKDAFRPRTCGCADGRNFAIGASVFGKNSARVVITGFDPDLPANIPGSKPALCTDLLVLGQVIELARTEDGRPFLERRSLKRGIIHNICGTKIHFVQPKKTYDFFADGGSALILREEQLDALPVTKDGPSQIPADEVDLDENLTGRDLLELTRRKLPRGSSPDHPENATFDSTDLKEGAYFVCRRRSRTALVGNGGLQRVGVPPTSPARKQDISIPAGTLGTIKKSAGFRSEPLWLAEIIPDSAPRPFLRSLIFFPRSLGGEREPAYPLDVILASGDVIEINEFLDRSRTEWTRLGEATETSTGASQGTARLPALYGRPVVPLAENLTMAERSGVLAAVQKATLGLRLVFRNPNTFARHGTLLLDGATPRSVDGNATADLWRRQCFLGIDRLGDPLGTKESAIGPVFFVTSADIKVFRPKDTSQVPSDYYAIDLELQLRLNSSPKQIPLVCRFPLVSIDLTLIDMAQGILSTAFEIRRETSEVWRTY
jgi:hypothetical protein